MNSRSRKEHHIPFEEAAGALKKTETLKSLELQVS